MGSRHVVIVAAGSGSRFGGSLPKQFCLLAGKPVLMHSIERLRRALPDAGMTVVLNPSMRGYWQELCEKFAFDSPAIADGGSSRSDSVRNALLGLDYVPDVILVHDGARPLVSAECVRAAADAVGPEADGAIPAIAVTDSLRRVRGDSEWSEAADRAEFRAVQTPQAFCGPKLVEAYRSCAGSFSDDASIMQHCGHNRMVLTPGETTNIKITNPIDLAIAEIILRQA